jgi:uncharacterized repeat protein (TIGR01451 family)
MKKIFFLFIFCIVIIRPVYTQAVEWIVPEEGMGIEVCTDPFNNIFTAGQYVSTVTIGNNTYTSFGYQDVMVIKYDAAGNILWSTALGGIAADYVNEMVFDPLGYIWITGQFNATLQAGSFSLTTTGSTDGYVIKINASNGVVEYADNFGGTGNDVGLSIKNDNAGNIYIGGTYTSAFTFNTISLPSAGQSEVFIVKLDGSGNTLWGKSISGTAIETMWSMDVDDNASIYVAGTSTSASTNFAGTNVTLGITQKFIVKLNAAGNYIWSALGNFNGEIYGLCSDVSGNTYFTGNFDTQASFGAINLTGAGNDEILVGKVNANGTFDWVQNYGGTGIDGGYDIEMGNNGNILLVGSCEASFTMGSTTINAGGFAKAFIANLNAQGNINWVLQSSGPASAHYGYAVTQHPSGDIYMSGPGGNTFNFGSLSANLSTGSYLVKIVDNANIIQGTVYFDSNSNSIFDGGEIGIPNVVLQLNNTNYVTSTNANGEYFFYTLPGIMNIEIPNIPVYHSLTTNPTLSTTFNGLGNIQSGQDFGLTAPANINDLKIDITPVSAPKAGLVLSYLITFKNVGTSTINTTVNFTYDQSINYLTASPAPSGINGQTLEWNTGALLPQQLGTIHAQFTIPTNMNIGDVITSNAAILPVLNDSTPMNNQYISNSTVVGPYDPNYKEVNIDTLTDMSAPGWLEYIIYFQNIGNAEAQDVVIIDTFSLQLDLSSIEMIASSHQPLQFSLRNGHIGEFRFNNIMLPDSASDPIGSCGFVKFRVKYFNTMQINEEIQNFSDIYFDYNPPIRTNTVSTIYVVPDISSLQEEDISITISPNPAKDYINILLNENWKKTMIDIYDVNGKIIHSEILQGNKVSVSTHGWDAGLYILEIRRNTTSLFRKFIKQ